MTHTFVDDLVAKLIDKKLTIATCESITGGMIASNIVNVPNASKVFLGGLIAYSNEAKVNLVNVRQETLTKYGAISKETVKEMAKGTLKKFKSDIVIAISGNAGPNLQENKPIGMAYLAVTLIDQIYIYELHSKEKERNNIRIDLTFQALNIVLGLIK